MKRNTFFFLLLMMAFGITSNAQTFSDVFDPKTQITWLGIDFTALKVIGDREAWANKTPNEMFDAWNKLMIAEREKYNVEKALHRDEVRYAVDVALDHNAALNVTDLFADVASSEFLLRQNNIQAIINTYNFKSHSGIGLLFIAESFDKTAMRATFWVTFINMDTRQILFTQKMTNPPGGFGLRNFWASPVYAILKKIDKSEYKSWQKSATSVK
jgi:hypothetical protein